MGIEVRTMFTLFKNINARKPSNAPGSDGAVFRVAPDVKASQHPDGVVLIHLGRGTVYSANRVGAMIWNGVVTQRSIERVTESISREFHIPAQTVLQDAALFLAQLQAEGLLIPEAQ